MDMENVFCEFKDVKNAYIELINICKNGSFSEENIKKIKKGYKRIEINNCILSIFNVLERLNIDELDEDQLNTLKEKIEGKFEKNNINIDKLFKEHYFRNALAHGRYNVVCKDNKWSVNIYGRKDENFNIDLSIEELNTLANGMKYVLDGKYKYEDLYFDSEETNEFIEKVCSANVNEEIEGNTKIYATLLESYNVYCSYLYEKFKNENIKTNNDDLFQSYLDGKILLNNNLPYMNGNDDLDNNSIITFTPLEFSNMTNDSKKELLYYFLTSEYRNKLVELTTDYFDNHNENITVDNIEDLEQKYNNKKESFENDLSPLMIEHFPKIGKIENENSFVKSKDLMHGFESKDGNCINLIYPDLNLLIKDNITDNQLCINFLNQECENLNITEEYLINKLKLTDSKSLEKLRKDFLKDLNKNSVEDKINNLIEICDEKLVDAYKCLIYIFNKNPGNGRILPAIESFNDIYEDELNSIPKENEDYNIVLFGKSLLGDAFKNKYKKKNVNDDYSNLIRYIRNSSMHALVEVDYPNDSYDSFWVKREEKEKTIVEENEKTKNFQNIKFNFQDYDESNRKTAFLLTNFNASDFEILTNIYAENIERMIERMIERDRKRERKFINDKKENINNLGINKNNKDILNNKKIDGDNRNKDDDLER